VQANGSPNRWMVRGDSSTKSLEQSEVIIQYIHSWQEVLSLISIENFVAEGDPPVIPPIRELLGKFLFLKKPRCVAFPGWQVGQAIGFVYPK
jgi:hypothetical protein